MSKLQELLDKKFPLTRKSSEDDKRIYEVWRDIFHEGYVQAMRDIVSASPGVVGVKRIAEKYTNEKF